MKIKILTTAVILLVFGSLLGALISACGGASAQTVVANPYIALVYGDSLTGQTCERGKCARPNDDRPNWVMLANRGGFVDISEESNGGETCAQIANLQGEGSTIKSIKFLIIECGANDAIQQIVKFSDTQAAILSMIDNRPGVPVIMIKPPELLPPWPDSFYPKDRVIAVRNLIDNLPAIRPDRVFTILDPLQNKDFHCVDPDAHLCREGHSAIRDEVLRVMLK